MDRHHKVQWGASATLVLALGSLVLCGAKLASASDAETPVALNSGTAGPKECVSWETRSVFGGADFDHSISLTSTCATTMRCAIKPSIGDALSATVAPNKTEHVLIWRGSPAREVNAEVTCEPAR